MSKYKKEDLLESYKEKVFGPAVCEEIGYYVYFLRDPRNQIVFYVGKGVDNRVFTHVFDTLETEQSSNKMELIREIHQAGLEVEYFILRHGLNEKTAYEVEAAMIDFIGLDKLSNEQDGHHNFDFGLRTTDQVKALYEAEDFAPEDPLVLININKQYKRTSTPEEIYQFTRKSWVMAKTKLPKIKYAVATYGGLTREVYTISKWEAVKKRWAFHGELAPEQIRQKYIYKKYKQKKGAANPIRYFNI